MFRRNQTIPVSHLIKLGSIKQPELKERNIRDSPYTSSYASKGKRKKSKENNSKEALRKSILNNKERGKIPENKYLFRRKEVFQI